MTKPLIYYWSSSTRGTARMADKLDTKTVEITPGMTVNHPFILMTPSYGSPRSGNNTPKPVRNFLQHNAHNMIGVIGSGNLSFQEEYCAAADQVSAAYGVPVLYRFELYGTPEDVHNINTGIATHWDTLRNLKESHAQQTPHTHPQPHQPRGNHLQG